LVGFIKRVFGSRLSEETMSGFATSPSPRASRWIWIAASVLALLGSLAVAAPAQASDFYGPAGYGYGPPRYGYDSYRNDCSSCGCYRCGCGRCYSGGHRGGVVERRYYERKYVERSYVERRYVRPFHHDYPRYGYGCCNSPYRSSYSGYGGYSRSFPWGYGGVRSDGYGQSGYYDQPPRPPAPVGYGSYDDGRWDSE
jgi:hypothetical protein